MSASEIVESDENKSTTVVEVETSNSSPKDNDEALPNAPRKSVWIPKTRMTIMASIVATIGSFGLGMTLVWSAIALDSLQKDAKFGKLESYQISLIGSMIYLGALISAPLTGILITTVGRKKAMLLIAVPCFLGWMIISFAQNIAMIYAGRFITGFCGGAFTVAVPTYVSEITDERVRGALGTVMILMIVTGIEFTFIIGAFVNWFALSLIAAGVPVIFFVCMIFMPESPRYLIISRRLTAARRALQWLRRASTLRHIEPEMSKIEISVADSDKQKKKKSSFSSLFMTAPVIRPIGISVALMAFSQLCGMNGIALYTSSVFEKAGTSMEAKYALIIIWGFQVLAVIVVTFFLVEKVKRKILFMVSHIIMIVGLVAFGVSFYVQVDNKIPSHLSWLPLTALVTFIIGYNLGIGPLSWLVTSEILAPNAREFSSSIVTLLYWTLSFVAGITFLPLEKAMGSAFLYWTCAIITFISALFVVFFVPETKGISSEEIQKYFGAVAPVSENLSNETIILNDKDLAQIKQQETEFYTKPEIAIVEGVINPSFEDTEANKSKSQKIS